MSKNKREQQPTTQRFDPGVHSIDGAQLVTKHHLTVERSEDGALLLTNPGGSVDAGVIPGALSDAVCIECNEPGFTADDIDHKTQCSVSVKARAAASAKTAQALRHLCEARVPEAMRKALSAMVAKIVEFRGVSGGESESLLLMAEALDGGNHGDRMAAGQLKAAAEALK